MEFAISFMLGAMSGGTLAATEIQSNQIMAQIISGPQLNPVRAGIKSVGALGLGTLLGATALMASMTAMVTGVISAASVALFLLSNSERWPAAGLVATLATTLSGAAMGAITEKLSMSYGVVSLQWALGIFTILKLLVYIQVKFACTQQDFCGILGTYGRWKESSMEANLQQQVVLEMEQRIFAFEMEKAECMSVLEDQRKEREEIKRQKGKAVELEANERTNRRRLLKMRAKYMNFLTFSSIPMTVIALVTTGFGVLGFGEYRFVFVILLTLVLSMSFWLMRSKRLHFWMVMGCLGMFGMFAVALLTEYAGQEAVGMSVKMQMAGLNVSMENISIRMTHSSAVQAISAGFYVSEVCQVALGASVGGLMVREAGGKGIVVASVNAVVVLLIVNMSSLMLGAGGTAGALLGASGLAAVSMGGASARGIKSSSWGETIGSAAGMIAGFLVFGNGDFVNIGFLVCVAYIFSMTNLY